MLGRRGARQVLFEADHLCRDTVWHDSSYGSLGRLDPQLFKDEAFAGLYREEHSRPSVPPSRLCMARLLQTHDGVSDDEGIERTAYDLRWKVALGLELRAKLCAKSTLQLSRAKLVVHEQYGQIFEASVTACRRAGLLKRRKVDVAIDTTPVLGRGAVKDTYNLISDKIRTVLHEACALKGWDRGGVITEQRLSRYFSASLKGAVELDWEDPAARRALIGQMVGGCAGWRWHWQRERWRGFAPESTQTFRAARELLADLLPQNIDEEPADGGAPILRQGASRDRVVSTTDPEMRHGHKSHGEGFEGYKASADLRVANIADGDGAAALVEQAAQCAACVHAGFIRDDHAMLDQIAWGSRQKPHCGGLWIPPHSLLAPNMERGVGGL